MKSLMTALCGVVLLAAFSSLAATPPQFQNIVATQRPGTMVVDVTYDLITTNSPWVYVSAQFSTNGGASYFTPFSPITGDVGPVTPGTNKKITWNAWNDFPNNFTTNAKVLLFGDDTASATGIIPTNSPDGNPNLVYIPPGVFKMTGSYYVYLTRAFWMSKYEVTQAEYQNVMSNNPSSHTAHPNCPVENVTWDQALAYCNALNARETAVGTLPTGWAYRLPTEAEWEYCCRAGTTNTYYFGEDSAGTRILNYAWVRNNSGGQTHDVGLKAPNRWGLYDMVGNVFEFCFDWYNPTLSGGVTDPTGPPFEMDTLGTYSNGKVIRGASYDDSWSGNAVNYAPSGTRAGTQKYYIDTIGSSGTSGAYDGSDSKNPHWGFRVVLAPTP